MPEIKLSPIQLQDSIGRLDAAVDGAFSASDVEAGAYIPDAVEVPRPSFELFSSGLEAYADAGGHTLPPAVNGRFEVDPRNAAVLTAFAGLRGIARVPLQTSSGIKYLIGPAIILAGGQSLAMLTAEQPSPQITDMQHALLDGEYAKQFAKVSSEHSRSDVTNAGQIGAALVVASSVVSSSAHREMHGLADSQSQTFGANFSADGRQDLRVGHDTRYVRSAVVATDRATLYAGPDDQLPAGAKPLGVELTADELAVGMTLAATELRGLRPNLVANLTDMVGE